LKRHGMIPPNMMGPEFDENKQYMEYLKGLRNPGEDLLDDEDDECFFEIAIINKKNKALVIES
jgi:hypothetical protein